MAHALPLVGTPQRDMFDVADLVAVATGAREPVDGIQGARALARKVFASDSGLIARVAYIVLEGDDRLSLISVGSRGGWKREWTFGYGLKGDSRRAA